MAQLNENHETKVLHLLKQKSLVSQRLVVGVVLDNTKLWNAVTNINLNVDSNTI